MNIDLEGKRNDVKLSGIILFVQLRISELNQSEPTNTLIEDEEISL